MMTDDERKVFNDWVAHSCDEFAQRIREAIAPTIADLGRLVMIGIDMGIVHHERRHIMRKKIRRCYRDQAQTNHSQAHASQHSHAKVSD